MLLMQAQTASVGWDSHKRRWTITLKAGEEVIRRSPDRPLPRDAADEALQTLAVNTAKEEGYEIRREQVTITR